MKRRGRTVTRLPDLSGFEQQSLLLVLIVGFLPYIGVGPLNVGSQVQPWGALLAWLWVLLKLASSGVRVRAAAAFILAFAIFALLYIYQGTGFNPGDYLRRSSAFLLSGGLFLAAQYASPTVVWRALRLVLPVWLAFAVLRYASPALYFSLVTPLVPTVVNSDARGASSLAPEATDFGFMMVALLVIAMVTHHRLRLSGVQTKPWPIIAAIAGALLSQSGTGFFGLAIVGITYLSTRPVGKFGRVGRWVTLGGLVVLALAILNAISGSEVRGVDLLTSALQDPASLMDGTVSYRVVHNAVGLLGLIDTGGLGYGAGAYIPEATGIYIRHDLGNFFGLTGYYAMNVPATLSQSPVSQFAVIFLEYGVIGVVYVLTVFFVVWRSAIPFRLVVVSVMFLTWVQSFPAAWPPFWILLGLALGSDWTKRSEIIRRPRNRLDRRSVGSLT